MKITIRASGANILLWFCVNGNVITLEMPRNFLRSSQAYCIRSSESINYVITIIIRGT